MYVGVVDGDVVGDVLIRIGMVLDDGDVGDFCFERGLFFIDVDMFR